MNTDTDTTPGILMTLLSFITLIYSIYLFVSGDDYTDIDFLYITKKISDVRIYCIITSVLLSISMCMSMYDNYNNNNLLISSLYKNFFKKKFLIQLCIFCITFFVTGFIIIFIHNIIKQQLK